MIEIFINGRFLSQQITGVQRYGREMVEAIDQKVSEDPTLLKDVSITLLAPKVDWQWDYQLRSIKIKKVGFFKGHAWEQFDLPAHVRGRVLFCLGNTAPILSLLTSPVVVTVHDLSSFYFPDAYSPAFRAFYRVLTPIIFSKARAVITVAESEREAMNAYFPAAHARVKAIQNGGWSPGHLDHVSEVQALPIAPGYGLYVGSLSNRKNFPRLLEAAIVFARETGREFVFVGGTQKALHQVDIKISPDVQHLIHFAGQINDAKTLMSWYRGARFVVFPSLYEASPLPPIESMGLGCPVLASSIPSMIERCGDAALYCDPLNAEDIADKMIQLCHDENLLRELCARGKRRSDQFTWALAADQTWSTLMSIAEGRDRQ